MKNKEQAVKDLYLRKSVGLISKEECKKAIEMFENGKTPGNVEYLLNFIRNYGIS